MMDWDLAIAKNLEALRHILTMLVGLVEIADGRSSYGAGDARQKSLPRHLHRFVLRLLRPAESATRRLIFIAARGLEVTVPPPRIAKRKVAAEPVLVRNEFGIAIVMVPGQRLTPAGISPTASQRLSSFPLLDPFKRFGFRRRYVKPSAMPRIRLLGGDPVCPLFSRPEPPVPPPPSLDDPLDAASIHRRLGAIGRVLDDLPTQALRMARWQARRHARFEQEREPCLPLY